MQVRPSKVPPSLFQIAQLAGKDFCRAPSRDGVFPQKGHITIGIAVKKRECLDHNRNRRVKLRSGTLQKLPLLARLVMQRIADERKRDPRTAVHKDGLTLTHQGSS